ncbi:ABC transporter ATP-binding protein/permease [Candidatus Pelagibacter bacterium]|nr:ABC transporter ATP-binding protein [Candidatus Pelagibacter bacterium]MDA8841977.1 ABC transporter ATP-binding protein/permease [Candidatus Pelagibacter bacterium]
MIFFQKIFLILNNKNKLKFFLISFLGIVRALSEILGIALIIPILTLISDPNGAEKLTRYLPIFQNMESNTLILIFIIIFLFVYFIKTNFLIFFNIVTTRFAQNLFSETFEKVLKIYLKKNYSFFSKINSAKLIRNISGETNIFALGVIASMLTLFTNIFLVAGIFVLLISYNFNTLYIILAMSLISIVIVNLNNTKNTYWAKKRQFESEKVLKKLNEIFGSIKEIIIYDKRSFFLKGAKLHVDQLAKAGVYRDVSISIYAPIIEFLAILIFCLYLIFLFIYKDTNFDEIIVFIGVLVFASLRILPYMIQIVRSIQSIKFNYPAVNAINNILGKRSFRENKDKINNKNKLLFKNEIKALDLKNVSFSYKEKSKKIINKLNYKMLPGDIIGIIGQSGSGKTTLINLISGLLKPTSGKILINKNHNIKFENIKDKIGYVSQTVYLSDESIKSNIALGNLITKKEEKYIDFLLKKLNLSELNKNLNIGEKGSRISGGQIQRIGIARALFRNPEILILDEATSSLDQKNEKIVVKFLKKFCSNKILIFSTHKIKLLTNCNKIIKINN